MKSVQSLRSRLFFWYLGSLLLLSIFFFLAVHIFAVPYGTDYFFALLLILAFIGFIIIYRITNSITSLSSQIKRISSKNLEQRIQSIHSNDEIGELANSFNSLLDRLHAAFDREQQFIADVAHEMKTPLATLRSSFEVTLSKDRTKEEYKKAIQSAIIEADQLSSTMKDVLDLAWSESPTEQKPMTEVNLGELMEELGDIAQKLAIAKRISVKTNIAKNVKISGYKEKLAQAVLNIIENAIKYTHTDGKVTIILEKLHVKAIITITDTGSGIAQEDIPHIFDRFYRGTKTDKVLGSGLGLAISKSIISLHQGYIVVDSIPKKGSTFTITLPLL